MAESWTVEDEDTLSTLFGVSGREELHRLFPARSYRSVKEKAIALGLLRLPSEDELRERVSAGHSLRQMGREFNLDGKTIHRYCRQHGIELRSQRDATSQANRNGIDPTFLQRPLSPAASWLLGIIATDGNVSDGGRLRVNSVDEDIVRQCYEVAGCGTVCADQKAAGRPIFVWSYTAIGLIEHLAVLGIEPRKTFTLAFPDPDTLHLPSFARGCWDGDGYWRRGPDGALEAGFGSSSLGFIEAFWEHLRPVTERSAQVYKHPTEEHWVIRVSRMRARRLAAWMYAEPCDVYCGRKYEIIRPDLETVQLGKSG